MEGVVAKRCLRNSSIGNICNVNTSRYNTKETINNVYRKNISVGRKINKDESQNQSFIEKYIFNIKMKLWIQSISAMCVLIIAICISMFDVKVINNNKYIKLIKSELYNNYSLEQIENSAEKGIKYCYSGIIKIVPDKVENKIKAVYLDFKSALKENKDEGQNNINIYLENDNKKEEIQTEENTGIGVSIDESVESSNIEETKEYQTAVSTISSEEPYLQYIYDNNIKFVMPTKGTISSKFGAREVIFEDIDSYHTGVDIANKKGTHIYSSINGKITKVANNKYNGNFVEITNGKVTTKYAHMDSVVVKQGAEIKAGELIGYMGETGYATGPHLHFEVVVDSVKIDPAKVLEM